MTYPPMQPIKIHLWPDQAEILETILHEVIQTNQEFLQGYPNDEYVEMQNHVARDILEILKHQYKLNNERAELAQAEMQSMLD